MDGLYHRDRLRTFSTVLLFLAFQAPCSFTLRPTQTSDNFTQKRFIAEKLNKVSAVYLSVTLSPRRVKPVSFSKPASLQRRFSNLITPSRTTDVMATVNTMSSCEVPVCSSLESFTAWDRSRNNQEDHFRVFYKVTRSIVGFTKHIYNFPAYIIFYHILSFIFYHTVYYLIIHLIIF